MADGTTTNYGFTLPEVGASEDSWGAKLNQNWTDLDADLDALQDAIDNIELFPTGTLMLFQQTSAPTGWTKQTTHNDKALRVVSGTASSGGSTAFATAFGTPSVSGSVGGAPSTGNLAVSVSGNISSHTLSINEIPSHDHSYLRQGRPGGSAGGTGLTVLNEGQHGTGLPSNYTNGAVAGTTGTSGVGGGHSHGHNLAGSLTGDMTAGNLALSSATAAINVQYVDLIIASKD